MNFRGFIATGSAALLALGAAGAHAQPKEQFVPANFYWVGPYAAGGSGIAGGMLDYLGMRNARDGGLNGVEFDWQKCETGQNHAPDLAAKYGYQLSTVAVPHPGNEQQSQWLRIREIRPDWVILWGWGVMNPTALKTAAKVGFPRTKMIGVWWSGAEEDVIPAGSAAK